MAKVLFETECVVVYFDEVIPAVYEDWRGHVTLAEFKAALEAKLAGFIANKRQYPKTQWLSDVRGLYPTPEIDQWSIEDFHPRLYATGVRKIAFVVSEAVFEEITHPYKEPRLDARQQIWICYFNSFIEAANWLREENVNLVF